MIETQPLPYVELDLTIKGISRSIGLSITPVLTGNKPLCLVIARDVTAIRDATRMKANFLSMITHELRSPLNAINGYLDLALTGIAGDLNEQQQEFVQRARAGSEHLYALVEDLLLVSRADAGQLRLNPEIVRLKEIVSNAIEELELLALDNGISTSIDIPSDLPAVYADPVRLQQVLRNLISNALRFTPSGGSVTISARVVRKADNNGIAESANSNGHAVSPIPLVPETPIPSIGSNKSVGALDEEGTLVAAHNGNFVPSEDAEESFVLVQVCDTGRGIAPEHQERIFERFYQIPLDTAGRSSGQGLGLAIVKMIVELHGGQVMVESTPDQGSTFSFTLPGLLS
jgi:signal transduction histidine kinase